MSGALVRNLLRYAYLCDLDKYLIRVIQRTVKLLLGGQDRSVRSAVKYVGRALAPFGNIKIWMRHAVGKDEVVHSTGMPNYSIRNGLYIAPRDVDFPVNSGSYRWRIESVRIRRPGRVLPRPAPARFGVAASAKRWRANCPAPLPPSPARPHLPKRPKSA
jgi:hypothetical protein